MAGHFWPFLDRLQMDLHSVTFELQHMVGEIGSFIIPQHVSNLHLAMV